MFRDRTGSFRRPGIGGRVLAIAVGGLLAVVVLVVGAGLLWLRTSVPALDGRLEGLPGLTGQAAISRDSRGVVYITAETPADASFALGFAHAQDRLWPMEMTRRIGAGRLAELVGDAEIGSASCRERGGTYG